MSSLPTTQYVWPRDGSYGVGTLKDYALMWEDDQYAGENDLTTQLLTWEGGGQPVTHDVHIERGFTVDGWTGYILRVPSTGEATQVKLPVEVSGERST